MSEIFVKKYEFHRQVLQKNIGNKVKLYTVLVATDLCDYIIWRYLIFILEPTIMNNCRVRACNFSPSCVQRFKVAVSRRRVTQRTRFALKIGRVSSLKTLNCGSSIIDVDHWSRTNDRLSRVSPAYKNRRDRAVLNDPLGRSIHGIPDLKIQRDLSFYPVL